MAFADRLEAALKAWRFEVLIDRQEIYAFEDWWKRIQALIGQADTVAFVLSPDAVASDVALKEVAYAASLNKRFAPIVCRRVEESAVPEVLRRLNFIFFDDPQRFDASAEALTNALETDINWIRQHTEYGEAQRRWSSAGQPNGLLLQPPTLDLAEYWLASRPRNAPEPTEEIRSYVLASRKRARASQRLWRGALMSTLTFMVATILGLVGWINHEYVADQWRWYTVTLPYARTQVWPHVMTATQEQALKPGDTFRECDSEGGPDDECPEMVVVPPGSFLMGSPLTDKDRQADEQPQHSVTIGKPFAVAKFELTFAEWDNCAKYGGCDAHITSAWGRDQNPVINVTWDDAQTYVAWLSKVTGKSYRLLTEAEYEYATRAGTQTIYPWGNDVGENNANCSGCLVGWQNTEAEQPRAVGRYPPNGFGLYDMVGNVYSLVADGYHGNYQNAPRDGSIWESCVSGADTRSICVLRGGSYHTSRTLVRSAYRTFRVRAERSTDAGFRVARTLAYAPSGAALTQSAGEICAQDDQQSNWAVIVANCTQVIALDPKNEAAFYHRARAFSRLKNNSAAIADYDQAIKLDPNDALAYWNRGLLYGREGDYDRAIADYTAAIRLDPKYAAAYNNRGNAYQDKRDYDRAIADYNEAIQLNPKYTLAYNNRGIAYAAKGDYDRAIADYNEAIQLNPKYAVAYYNRGLAWEKKNDPRAALADFKKFTELDPSDSDGPAAIARVTKGLGQ